MNARIDPAVLQQRVRDLPALPQAIAEALTALRNEAVGADRCAELIGRDPVLAARVLRLANSAFYGVPGRVNSIRDAVHLLGRRALGSLLTVAMTAGLFDASRCKGFDYSGFWRHGLATALAARALARTLQADEDGAFTCGLLHDIGRLALAAQFPEALSAALQRGRELDGGEALFEVEVLGVDHAAYGAAVARQWRLPAEVVQAIASHHAPMPAAGGGPSQADIVHCCDAIAHALDLAGDAEESVPHLDAGAWQRVALPAQSASEIFAQTESALAELAKCMGL